MEIQLLLSRYIPAVTLDYCVQLWHHYDFDLYISRPRRTRFGDFSVKPGGRPRITVNANLNPYSFLVTYIHEVAHCAIYRQYLERQYSKRVAPHGQEWKTLFSNLLQPILNEATLPTELLLPLKKYAISPKASTSSDAALLLALKQYDLAEADNKMPLLHLSEGTIFVFQKREFIRGTLRRTRVICTEKASQRRYTIPAHALVEQVELYCE
jgi:SprT protein